MARKNISRNEVNESNKLEFFNQEARNVSKILNIKAFDVELAPEVKNVEIVKKENTTTIRFNTNVVIDDALIFIPNVGRQIWRSEKKLSHNIAECTIFAAEYLMYIHKYVGHAIKLNFPENKRLENYINFHIEFSWMWICFYGNGYEEKCDWIAWVRNRVLVED